MCKFDGQAVIHILSKTVGHSKIPATWTGILPAIFSI